MRQTGSALKYLHVYMLRPNSQPLAGFKTGRPVSKPARCCEAGYSFYTINIWYEVLRRPFVVKNLETTVYMISFVMNVANCSRTIDA